MDKKRSRVIEGLEHHIGSGNCFGCPYHDACSYDERAGVPLLRDVVDVLRKDDIREVRRGREQ